MPITPRSCCASQCRDHSTLWAGLPTMGVCTPSPPRWEGRTRKRPAGAAEDCLCSTQCEFLFPTPNFSLLKMGCIGNESLPSAFVHLYNLGGFEYILGSLASLGCRRCVGIPYHQRVTWPSRLCGGGPEKNGPQAMRRSLDGGTASSPRAACREVRAARRRLSGKPSGGSQNGFEVSSCCR